MIDDWGVSFGVKRNRFLLALAGLLPLAACAQVADSSTPVQRDAGILAGSSPAAGSVVKGPLNEMVLRFRIPARLMEVTVKGPDGVIPMMLSPAGETVRYVVPLAGLGAGSYSAAWRASARGREYRGTVAFSVRQ